MQTPHFPPYRRTLISAFVIFLAAGLFLPAQDIAGVNDHKNILPERERARVFNDWLKWRLDNFLPTLMRREGIDMWLVISPSSPRMRWPPAGPRS